MLGFTHVDVFFFFQAEDGIRDIGVTGVQTCALPICFREDPFYAVRCYRSEGGGASTARPWRSASTGIELMSISSPYLALTRSEERRVGKECRSRWSPYH